MEPLDEKTFVGLADGVLRGISRALDAVDPDLLEVDEGGGYLTLTFKDGARCVINSQRPAREIWMAADETAWHFGHVAGRWEAQKSGEELYATLRALVKKHLDQDIHLPA